MLLSLNQLRLYRHSPKTILLMGGTKIHYDLFPEKEPKQQCIPISTQLLVRIGEVERVRMTRSTGRQEWMGFPCTLIQLLCNHSRYRLCFPSHPRTSLSNLSRTFRSLLSSYVGGAYLNILVPTKRTPFTRRAQLFILFIQCFRFSRKVEIGSWIVPNAYKRSWIKSTGLQWKVRLPSLSRCLIHSNSLRGTSSL